MIRTRPLAVTLSLVLLAGVAGCSGSDKADSPTSTTGATPTLVTATTTPPLPTPTVASDSGAKAEAYAKKLFAGTPWIKAVKSVSVVDNTLSATTTLGTDKKATSDAKEICRALSAYQVSDGGFTGVTVKSKSGKVLVERKVLAKGC